ncbi:hypothetical protein HDU76_005104 [Blyttiomyces sp. JEL0837]|nr:hypothetical protein HDU76_005104 [Blyttiomyces sp. JEL0837]
MSASSPPPPQHVLPSQQPPTPSQQQQQQPITTTAPPTAPPPSAQHIALSHTHPLSHPPPKPIPFSRVMTPIDRRNLRFLIFDAPNDANLNLYLTELKARNVTDVVRVCEPTYQKSVLEKEGIRVVDWPFADGSIPPLNIIQGFLGLCEERFVGGINGAGGAAAVNENAEPTGPVVGIHCVAGLGRAPVLVAIALIESGMAPLDAVDYVRKRRRGAFNSVQLTYLVDSYKRSWTSKSSALGGGIGLGGGGGGGKFGALLIKRAVSPAPTSTATAAASAHSNINSGTNTTTTSNGDAAATVSTDGTTDLPAGSGGKLIGGGNSLAPGSKKGGKGMHFFMSSNSNSNNNAAAAAGLAAASSIPGSPNLTRAGTATATTVSGNGELNGVVVGGGDAPPSGSPLVGNDGSGGGAGGSGSGGTKSFKQSFSKVFGFKKSGGGGSAGGGASGAGDSEAKSSVAEKTA